jgi:multisubunit Na+/H+ antiporter MnhG subunit
MRRELPVFIAGIAGFLMIAEYYFQAPLAKQWSAEIQNWAIVISAFTLCLGAVGLARVHGQRIARRHPDSLNSLLLIATMLITGVTGAMSMQHPIFLFIFNNVITPLGSAFYAMVALFVASSAYRAFRARSTEAVLFLVSGTIVMLGRAPVGEIIWNQFPVITEWIMKYPNLAGMRGVQIGVAVGVIAVGLRVLLGIDRHYLGGET